MDRYFTLMIVPEREKGIKSIRIPRIMLRALIFVSALLILLIGIMVYDYLKIVIQVYENKHIKTENQLLKEQIKLNQMKINTLTHDITRISDFEEKLRIITGLKQIDMTEEVYPNINIQEGDQFYKREPQSINKTLNSNNKKKSNFRKLKLLYEMKIAETFGQKTGYKITKKWSELTRKSFELAKQFAIFDNQFQSLKDSIKKLEIKIHSIDEYLLDNDSFLKSTPTLLPTKGWLTSYYGPRKSPYSGRIKMHEGVDIGARLGTAIIAPADGVVTVAGRKPGFGIYIQLDHGYGLETVYAHAQSKKVIKGEMVKRGQVIASVGNTGYSTGPHVHYEIWVNGTPVDPLYYILD